MRPVEILKDLGVFLSILPVLIILVFISGIFLIWKCIVYCLVKISYCNSGPLSFLTPFDLFFLSRESSENFHLNPKLFIPITLILEGRLKEEDLRQHFQQNVLECRKENGQLSFQRLQQKITTQFGYKFLITDHNFSVHNHIRTERIQLDEDSALEFIRLQNSAPIRQMAPLWEIILVPKYNGENKTMVLFRGHHSIMDGVSILSILEKCAFGMEFYKPSHSKKSKSLPQSPQRLSEWFRQVYRNSIALPRTFFREQAARRNIKVTPGDSFYYNKTPKISLSKFKRLNAENGVSFTVAITSALSFALGGIRSKIPNRAELGREEWITAMLALSASKKSGKDLGNNNFMLADVNIPWTMLPMSMKKRIQLCREEDVKARRSISPKVIGFLTELGNMLPTSLFLKYFVPSVPDDNGIVISNLPGFVSTCKLWDHNLLEAFHCLSATQNPWLTITIFSYSDNVQICLSGNENPFGGKEHFESFVSNFKCALEMLLEEVN